MERENERYEVLIKELLVAFVKNEKDINLFIDKLNEMDCFISLGAMPKKQTFPTQVLIKFFNITTDDKQEMYEKINDIIDNARDNEIENRINNFLEEYIL